MPRGERREEREGGTCFSQARRAPPRRRLPARTHLIRSRPAACFSVRPQPARMQAASRVVPVALARPRPHPPRASPAPSPRMCPRPPRCVCACACLCVSVSGSVACPPPSPHNSLGISSWQWRGLVLGFAPVRQHRRCDGRRVITALVMAGFVSGCVDNNPPLAMCGVCGRTRGRRRAMTAVAMAGSLLVCVDGGLGVGVCVAGHGDGHRRRFNGRVITAVTL